MAGVWILILGINAMSLMHWARARMVNVALRKPASTTSGQHYSWSPGKAVDGDRDVNGESRTCFHAARSPSDWTVDLGQEYQLYDIRVYLRNDFEYSTANSIIYLDNNSSRFCYTFPTTISDNPTYVMCNGTARNVTIRNPGNGPGYEDALKFCEVEIYVCSNGTYGRDCNTPCGHCADLPCDRWTGVCNGDCKAGWRGPRCTTACDNTTYGINCMKRCADRKCAVNTWSCDRFTGSCDAGCSPGWKGSDCTEMCGRQSYGISCTSLCTLRNCDGKSSCDHVTGSCDKGCVGGYKGLDCRQECDEEHYGPDCTVVCATRYCEGNSSCSPSTGRCDQGCQPGWTGIDCRECDEKHYGPTCNGVCMTRHCKGDSTCIPSTGECDGGCQTGWEGTDCTVESLDGGFSVGAIVGTVVGVVLLVLILILIIVVVLIRQRRSKMTSQSKEKVYDSLDEKTKRQKDPINVYDSLGSDEKNKTTAQDIVLVEAQGQHGTATINPELTSVDNKEDGYESLPTNIQERPDPAENNYYNLVVKQ